jgi:hypothetical protein
MCRSGRRHIPHSRECPVDGDIVRLDQAAVGRHRVPGLQEYDITGNQKPMPAFSSTGR